MKIISNEEKWDKELTIQLTLKEVMMLTAAVGETSGATARAEYKNWNESPDVSNEDFCDMYDTLCVYLEKQGIKRKL